jgi:hypothetical protein
MAKVSSEQKLMMERLMVENRNEIGRMNLAHEQSMQRNARGICHGVDRQP